ncbi:fibrinogen silencer-binding protein-like [Oncorhynchus masou masou]|uniref:fibrinogen silencer-binding protein-like n=1 Tax=Oncorhynchus masou masou TaxID=90313 RepID=UPI0031839B18
MSYLTPNFTMQQKLYILQRIQSMVRTVQDYRKDTNATVHCNAMWGEVVNVFNAAFPDRPPSSVGTMKTLWKRLKVESRQVLHRCQKQVVTGLPVTALTEVQQEITAMVPNLISNQDDMDREEGYTGLWPGSPTAGDTTLLKSYLFIKPFVHQLISQSAVQKPSLKPQTASNAGVEALLCADTLLR